MKYFKLIKLSQVFIVFLLALNQTCYSTTVSLFDGNSLHEWQVSKNDEKLWQVKNGVINGGSLIDKIKHNSFLVSNKSYQNFDLKLKIRLLEKSGFANSGIQIRSSKTANGQMSGYQVDVGPGWWGKMYDESRRNKVISSAVDLKAINDSIKKQGWNDFRILCQGKRIRSWINGLPALDFIEQDTSIELQGYIGIQIHGGGKALVQVKDISITELADTAELPTSGLILDLNADQGLTLEEEDRVAAWENQVASSPAKLFKKVDINRKAGSGRPSLRRNVVALNGHNTLVFNKQELINDNEKVFDQLTTGNGYTWISVMAADKQENRQGDLANVNSFMGNLKNGVLYEGFWAGFDDNNTVWMGSRNGVTMGRWDSNNPKVSGPRLDTGKYYIITGRMGAGNKQAKLDLFINDTNIVASGIIPVNVTANASKLAIGTERYAIEHPGVESFDGKISRLLIYNRPLSIKELQQVYVNLNKLYFD